MAMRYAITNYIGSHTPLYSSSEDDLYVLEYLYDLRPSKPFRFSGFGTYSGAIPEWICVDLGAPVAPNFTGIFNHNLSLTASGDLLRLLACEGGCPGQSGVPCYWEGAVSGMPSGSYLPACEIDLSNRLTDNFPNICKRFACGSYQYWMLEVIDANNSDGYIEIGEWFLGTVHTFTNARLQPGRSDGPRFFRGENITYYGQIWSNFYSDTEEFSIIIKAHNEDPGEVDEMRIFLQQVAYNAGKFVFIPDDHYKFCYYVYMENMSDFGSQIAKSECGELYEWRIDLRTLVQGVTLLG